jgi:uncharacterized membrane protein
MAHLLAVPLLPAPAAAFVVDDAGTAAAAAWIFVHSMLLVVTSNVFTAVLQRLHAEPHDIDTAVATAPRIDEPSKLLIRNGFNAQQQRFTVIFAVNLSGTSIGAGLRAI